MHTTASRPTEGRRAPARRLEALVGGGCLDGALGRLLAASVRAQLNIVISGPAGSGKSTLLAALCEVIPDSRHKQQVAITEVCGLEALEVLRTMARGAQGALTTVGSEYIDDTLPTLVALAQLGVPAPCGRALVETANSSVDLIVHLARDLGDAELGPPHVVEVAVPAPRRDGPFSLATLASFEPDVPSGPFRHFPVSNRLKTRLRAQGEPVPAVFEPDRCGAVRPALHAGR
jgi:hypothetical protein